MAIYFDYFDFQFHKGTIKARISLICQALLKPFNSIKVQLRRAPREDITLFAEVFQFHKGTIKASWFQIPHP